MSFKVTEVGQKQTKWKGKKLMASWIGFDTLVNLSVHSRTVWHIIWNCGVKANIAILSLCHPQSIDLKCTFSRLLLY